MSDDLKILGVDGIRRSYDEHYDTIMDVEQDPTGAWQAIGGQAYRIEELELALRYEADLAQQALDARKELEAKLKAKEKLMLALAGDKIDLVSELAGVKGKLAKVTEELEEYKWMYEDLCK